MDDETSITKNLLNQLLLSILDSTIYIYIYGSRWICKTVVILLKKMDGRIDRHICEEVNI